MGTSGAGIFADDVAADVRASYRELLEDGLGAADASHQVIECVIAKLDQDEAATGWLALAATQCALGRLQPDVKRRALEIIENGEGLAEWTELRESALRKRQMVLDGLRGQLVGPQKSVRPIRRSRRFETSLQPGDTLLYRSKPGWLAILHVDGLSDTRYGLEPCISWLTWDGTAVPSDGTLEAVVDAHRAQVANGSQRPLWKIGRARSSDLDYADAGFSMTRGTGSAEQRPSSSWSVGTSWSMLRDDIERQLRDRPPDAP